MISFEEVVSIKLNSLKEYLERNLETAKQASKDNLSKEFCEGEIYAFKTALTAVNVTIESLGGKNDRTKKRDIKKKI